MYIYNGLEADTNKILEGVVNEGGTLMGIIPP